MASLGGVCCRFAHAHDLHILRWTTWPMDHDHPKKSDKIEAITDQISKVVHDSLSTILQRTLGGASPSCHSATTTASVGSSAASCLSVSEDELRTIQKAKHLSRATLTRAIQKKPKAKKARTITVGICKMERNRQCGLKKSGDYFEVNFSPDDNYVTSVYKAVEAIGWEYDPADGAPFLCRANGIRIVDQPLASGSWTLGEYIKTQFKSTNNVRLGVALFEDDTFDELPPAKRPRCEYNHVQVLYAANINIGLDMTTAASREELWKKLKPSPNCNMMNVPLPWYPEQKDYAVCSIKHGGMTLLEYNEETGFMVHQDKSSLVVLHQSQDTVICSGQVIPLFCIASNHSLSYKYEWRNVNGEVGMASPVIYVSKPGVYRCTVHASERIGQTCLSKSIHVGEGEVSVEQTTSNPSKSMSSTTVHTSGPSTIPSTSTSVLDGSKGTDPNNVNPLGDEYPSCVREFTDEEVIQATNDMNFLIGKGGFGRVYRGSYHGTEVAVKILDVSNEHLGGSLSREVRNLTRFQHPNLIGLMGYCKTPPALVYPYMTNLSLYHCLHEYKVEHPLSWNHRKTIMVGTAKGLAYLHSSSPIFLHQDVKSHNILLDETFVAKVAGFGFVTPLPEDIGSTAVVTAEGVVGLAGTRGYLPPEHCDGKRGVKSDVYRYGIVCLETFTGLLAYAENREDCKLYDHCKEELGMWSDEATFMSAADVKMKDRPPTPILKGFMAVVYSCTQQNYKKRCTMEEVLRMWADQSNDE